MKRMRTIATKRVRSNISKVVGNMMRKFARKKRQKMRKMRKMTTKRMKRVDDENYDDQF